MSKFNPEDFKTPEMEPLSTVTIFDETIEWDKSANGVVAAYGDGSMHIVDGQAYYEQPRGEYGEGSVRIDLVIENDNIDTNMLACSVEARRLVYLDLLEECGGNEMKATYMLLKHYAKGKDISVVPNAHTAFMNILNPESRRVVDIGTFQMKTPNPDYVLPEVHSEAGKLSLSHPKRRPYGILQQRPSEDLRGAGKISEIDSSIFEDTIPEAFLPKDKTTEIDSSAFEGADAKGYVDLPEVKRYYRECSCKSCGAPIGFYGVSEKEYNDARFTGTEPNNFTTDELERHFGEVGTIDGVIYDDTRLCSSCRAYDY